MTYLANKDFYAEVAKGKVAGHTIVHKFGHNDTVGTTYEPITATGVYNTPQPASATTLRIKAPIEIGTGCDCGFMAKVNTGTANVEVDFELLLVNNNYL